MMKKKSDDSLGKRFLDALKARTGMLAGAGLGVAGGGLYGHFTHEPISPDLLSDVADTVSKEENLDEKDREALIQEIKRQDHRDDVYSGMGVGAGLGAGLGWAGHMGYAMNNAIKNAAARPKRKVVPRSVTRVRKSKDGKRESKIKTRYRPGKKVHKVKIGPKGRASLVEDERTKEGSSVSDVTRHNDLILRARDRHFSKTADKGQAVDAPLGSMQQAYVADAIGALAQQRASQQAQEHPLVDEGLWHSLVASGAAGNEPLLKRIQHGASRMAESPGLRMANRFDPSQLITKDPNMTLTNLLVGTGKKDPEREELVRQRYANVLKKFQAKLDPDAELTTRDTPWHRVQQGELADLDSDIAGHKFMRSEKPLEYWLNPFDKSGPLPEASDRLSRRSVAGGAYPDSAMKRFLMNTFGAPATYFTGGEEAQQSLRRSAAENKLYADVADPEKKPKKKSKKDEEESDVKSKDKDKEASARSALDWDLMEQALYKQAGDWGGSRSTLTDLPLIKAAEMSKKARSDVVDALGDFGFYGAHGGQPGGLGSLAARLAASLAVPAGGAGIGALINALRGKSIGRGAGVGALTALGSGLGATVAGRTGALGLGLVGAANSPNHNYSELSLPYTGLGLATGLMAGGGAGGVGGYRLGQKLYGPEESDEKEREELEEWQMTVKEDDPDIDEKGRRLKKLQDDDAKEKDHVKLGATRNVLDWDLMEQALHKQAGDWGGLRSMLQNPGAAAGGFAKGLFKGIKRGLPPLPTSPGAIGARPSHTGGSFTPQPTPPPRPLKNPTYMHGVGESFAVPIPGEGLQRMPSAEEAAAMKRQMSQGRVAPGQRQPSSTPQGLQMMPPEPPAPML